MELLHFDKKHPLSCLPYNFLYLLIFSPYYAVSQVHYFINCGSSADTTIPDGRTFVGDVKPHIFKLYAQRSKAVENSNQTTDPTYSIIYKSARVFSKASTYTFDIPQDANGTYILRLHFYAFASSTQLAEAQFDVTASGHILLPGFSVGETATNSAVVKEFLIRNTGNSTSAGKFRVHFVPKSVAFVNAIEILSSNGTIGEDTGIHVTPAGSKGVYRGPKSQALETVYRINVGGNEVMYDNLWRTWMPDDPFLVDKEAATNKTGSLSTTATSTYDNAAPTFVYETGKELFSSSYRNLTWEFNVSKGARYLVRLHFCDIFNLGLSDSGFNLSIFGKSVDIINAYNITQNIQVPFHKDYVVDSGNSDAIGISLLRTDGIAFLNGLEMLQVKNETAADPDHDNASHVGLIVGLIVATIVLALVLLLLFKRKKGEPVIEDFEWEMVQQYGALSSHNVSSKGSSSHENLHLRLKIPFRYIKQVTKDFDAELIIGEGGFGKVYKGTLKDGKKVAVKRSNPDHGQGLAEFQTEVMVLSKIRHKHLVSLIGYCYEDGEMILVYEFMEKGTLREHLYGSSISTSTEKMSWKQRLDICIGAAKGLHYLHTGADRVIIHRDVKSTNILLDESYVAKVADFGLSRLGHLEHTHVSTDVKGTFGYLDPEYFGCMQLTEKSDVYSFGVVLLEALCARPVIDNSLPKDQVNLAEWALACLDQGQIESIVEPSLAGEIAKNSLKKFVEIAAKCLKESAAERPPMSDIIWDLEYALQLQRAASEEELPGDSITDASLNIPASPLFPLQMSFTDQDSASLLYSSTGEVFSQIGFHDTGR